MKRYSILIMIFLLLGSCASYRNEEKQDMEESSQELEWRLIKSMTLFSYSEYERLNKNYDTAFDLVRMAEQFDPESIYLKEKIYQYLSTQARRDTAATEYMIQLGRQWYDKGIYNSSILFQLGEACLMRDDIESAKKFIEASLTKDAKRLNYLTYYLFQREYYPPADTLYLSKAVEGMWNQEDQGIIYQVVDLYKSIGKEKKARDLLLKSYERWRELQVLLNIVALNQVLGDWELTVSILTERQEQEGDLPAELAEYLISVYYDTGEYAKVVEMEEECRETGDELVMKMLFLSALQLGEYEVSYRIADLLMAAGFITEEYYPSFYGSLWELEMKAGNWSKAMENFGKVEDVLDKLGLIYQGISDADNKELLSGFLENYYQVAEDKDEALYLLLIFNLEAGERSRVEELLSLINKTYFEDHRLLIAMAAAYNSQSAVSEYELEYLEQQFSGEILLSGILFYYLQEEDKACQYLRESLQEGNINAEGILLLGTILLNQNAEDELIKVLDWGRRNFAENADILNFYGYQIAVQKEEDLYGDAEQTLLKALEQYPENAMYWDSLGWLYYRMKRYEPALAAMSHTADIVQQHIEIAYHYGAILYETGEYAQALSYLELVEQMEGEDALKKEAKSIIKQINDKE